MRLIFLLATLLPAVNSWAQIQGTDSLRTLCASAGDQGVHITVASDDPPPLPFQATLRATDLIVRGTVASSRARLSEDDRNISTSFELSQPRVLFAIRPQSSGRPGAATPIVFTLNGGTVMLGNCKATLAYDGTPQLRSGMEVLLLMRETADGTLVPLHIGMFALDADGVHPMLHGSGEHRKFEGRPVDAFVTDIVAARRALK